MKTFILILLSDLIIPLTMIVAGILMYKRPPKNINGLIGYRTPMSQMNKDTWNFAHRYCGKLWLRAGIILTVLSAAAHIPFINSDSGTLKSLVMIFEVVQIAVLMSSVIFVEKALKKTFDKNGNRK